jgi:hypothetical protein
VTSSPTTRTLDASSYPAPALSWHLPRRYHHRQLRVLWQPQRYERRLQS